MSRRANGNDIKGLQKEVRFGASSLISGVYRKPYKLNAPAGAGSESGGGRVEFA